MIQRERQLSIIFSGVAVWKWNYYKQVSLTLGTGKSTHHFITASLTTSSIINIMSVDPDAGGSRDWLFPSPSGAKQQQRDWIYPYPSLSSSRISKTPTRRFFSTYPSPPAPTTTSSQNRYHPPAAASAGIRRRINFHRRSLKDDVSVEKKTAVAASDVAKCFDTNDTTAAAAAAFKYKFSWHRIIIIAFPAAVSSFRLSNLQCIVFVYVDVFILILFTYCCRFWWRQFLLCLTRISHCVVRSLIYRYNLPTFFLNCLTICIE